MVEAYARSATDVARELGVEPGRGLDEPEIARRRKEHGPNRLRRKRQKSVFAILVDQFKSLIFLLLAAAAAASFVFSEPVQGAAIVVAMLVNAAIGFVTEWRAVRSMEALRQLERTEARVRRGGEEREVAADRLVPGDIVLLEAGDLVPADLRLIEARNLRCDEASLTGESVPVGKSTDPLEGEPPLAERTNMAFKGTSITNGAGVGVVVGTGARTELGRISELAEAAEEAVTPLEQRLDQLARWLLILILIIAAVTAAVGVVAGRDLLLMVETGIALVVAAVPEGLPIVASVALARGMWRLARRNALIEKLSAVETLGATNVICSDKTGTLTENRMTLSRLALADGEFELERADERRFCRDGQPADVAGHPPLRAALEIGALCNAATLDRGSEQDDRGTGDPMEIALLAGAAAAGIERGALVDDHPELGRLEFDPEVKMMATFHREGEAVRVAVKGAPEAVIGACARVLTEDGEQELDDAGRERWRERNEALAREGLRALALAQKTAGSEDEQPYEDLTLIGLVGLLDPPRKEVKDAIQACRDAGIKVVMVTGDQPATALAIAEAVGLVDRGADVRLSRGADLKHADEMSDEERRQVLETSIFARVDPKQKLDLIQIHQDHGARVAMTGDQPATALAIAEAVGLVDRGADVRLCRGADLKHADEMSDDERRQVLETSIFARVDPKQKLDLIQIHQDHGARVAMTGDGVNDAPALKKADIGIAMGRRGTQVAREAADMVLRDDSFATIVMAVAQGRVIFGNIRKFIMYMLSGNTGEIFAVALVALLNAPLPLLPLQILYINLITDVFPALALGVGRGEHTLDQPARDPKEPILTRRHWYAIGGYGAVIGGAVLAVFAYSLLVAGMTQERAVTISFLTFALARLWHVFNMRDAGSHPLRNPITTNPWVWAALAIGIALVGAALYVPLLSDVLRTVDPGAQGWLLIALGSLAPLVVGQLAKSQLWQSMVTARLEPRAAS